MDLIELKKVQNQNFKRHPWELTRLRVLLYFTRKITHPKLVVDIGSGDGFMAKNLALQFPSTQLVAVDINYTDRIKQQIQAGSPDNISYLQSISMISHRDNRNIDLVVLMDVLEHMEHPADFLHELLNSNAVSDATSFFITVPAYQWLYSGHDKVLGHFKRYSRKKLNQLLRAQGMEVKYSGYFFTTLLLVRAFTKLFPQKPGGGQLYNWKAGNWISRLITGFFWMEFRISLLLSRWNLYIPGLTCYCVCQPLPS